MKQISYQDLTSVKIVPANMLCIASNDRLFGCPIIYTDTIHITSNDRLFGCPIIYMDTIHITSNDHLFSCSIIYMDTIHIASNDNPFGCPIVYMDTIHITSNAIASKGYSLFILFKLSGLNYQTISLEIFQMKLKLSLFVVA